MLLVGISLGNNPYPWTNSHPLSLIIVGGLVLVSFGIFEWRCKERLLVARMQSTKPDQTDFPVIVIVTKIGIFHHDLFEGHGARVLGISIVLIAVEGLMLNTIIVFYPAMYVPDCQDQLTSNNADIDEFVELKPYTRMTPSWLARVVFPTRSAVSSALLYLAFIPASIDPSEHL